MSFRNLARKGDCDKYILEELERAMIPVTKAYAHRSEVPYTIIGKKNDFIFKRAWSYWTVSGLMPLEHANKLYEFVEAKEYVRAGGHCGCKAPESQSKYIDTVSGKQVWLRSKFEEETEKFNKDGDIYTNCVKPLLDNGEDKMCILKDSYDEEGIERYVTDYHIDTQAGLLLFSLFIEGII